VAGVEARRRLGGREHSDLLREARVEGRRGALRRRAALDLDRGDLAERVDTGVRAAGDGEVLHRREGLAERLPERRLDRRQPGLRSPAAKRRAVVLERQDEPHVR
jgi:hypothetical protein